MTIVTRVDRTGCSLASTHGCLTPVYRVHLRPGWAFDLCMVHLVSLTDALAAAILTESLQLDPDAHRALDERSAALRARLDVLSTGPDRNGDQE